MTLIALNWDLFDTQDGQIFLGVTILLAIGTHIFYFLTGVTDPGYVRNQIFENTIHETTEFVEEDQTHPEQVEMTSSKRRPKGSHARKPSTVLAELDKDGQSKRNSNRGHSQQH